MSDAFWFRADRFPSLPEHVLDRWADFAAWDTVFFPSFLGLRVEELRTDYARMRLPFRPELNQPAGVIHGGAIASLVDTVVVPAIGSAYDEPRMLLTIDMQLRYMGSISNEDAIAEGWVTQRGRRIVFCDTEVRGESGGLAASATITYKVGKPMPDWR